MGSEMCIRDSYYTTKYTVKELKDIGLVLPTNWNKQNEPNTNTYRYTYTPKDKELQDIIKNEQREIQKRLEQQIYEDDADILDDSIDEDIDLNVKDDVNLIDNYAYLLEYIKESVGQNDILTRLKEMEDKFNKVSKQYTTSCGSGKYPITLDKTELTAIKNREDAINMMNKKAIYDTKNEIHFYKDEMVLNITQTPFQLVKIIDIDHINGKMSVKPYKKTHLELSFSDVKKQLYNGDMIYIKMNNTKKNNHGLIHCVLKRTVYSLSLIHI